jgi:catechol 2,3-dioxygenase-like lactoylglutathione lyase family enzyme
VNVSRLDHVVFAVDDIDAAARSWATAFGLEAAPAQRPDSASVELAELPVGGGSAFVEIVRALDDGHPIGRAVAERGEGMLSLSLQVDNLDAAVAGLRAKGVAVSDPEAGLLPDTRVARFDPSTTHGVRLQLIER